MFLDKRKKLMLTQLETCELSQIQFRVYQRYEHGERTVSQAQMKYGLSLCALLEVDPYELCFGMSREEYLLKIKSIRKKQKIIAYVRPSGRSYVPSFMA